MSECRYICCSFGSTVPFIIKHNSVFKLYNEFEQWKFCLNPLSSFLRYAGTEKVQIRMKLFMTFEVFVIVRTQNMDYLI